MPLNPPGQYADDRNLSARQGLWSYQSPRFDLVGWVLGLADLCPGMRVLDVGCGNGLYLRELAARPVRTAGFDLSPGMLRATGHQTVAGADVTALPARDGAFDVVIAAHMLYHVPDRAAAARELRRVLAPGGKCIAVTNGARHTLALRTLIEQAVGRATPGWRMRGLTDTFNAENAAGQLSPAFASVTCVRPAVTPPVVIRDAEIVADYVASLGGFYQGQTSRPWPEVVTEVRQEAESVIARDGAFTTSGDVAAFICE